jgi:hypothetical protein
MSVRRLSYAALLMAVGLGGAYLHPIPNAQPLDLVIFCAGSLLGMRDGALVGGLTMLVYSTLNPYGVAPPLITITQVLGEAAYGVGGGLLARLGLPRAPLPLRATGLVVAALALTLMYDLVTNLGTGLLLGQVRVALMGGIPFALMHMGTNLVLFAALGTPLVAVLARYRERLSS